MNQTTIRTNHVPRFTIDSFDLTKKERAKFDYLSDEEIVFHSFVRYKGEVIDLQDFQTIRSPGSRLHGWDYVTHDINDPLRNWDGIRADSYFSAVVIKFADRQGERVICGQAFS